MSTEQPRIEYIEARRALLDALTALQPHVDAFVLIGAQAVYLRTAGRLPGPGCRAVGQRPLPPPCLLSGNERS